MSQSQEASPPAWNEEQLRYRVLGAAHRHTGGDCTRSVVGAALGADLDVPYEELHRVLSCLEEHGYLFHIGPGPRLCITPKGIRYIERAAGRRRSLRLASAM